MKDRIDWPEDLAEAQEARRNRMGCIMALRRKDVDYVDKILSEDLDSRTVFNLVTILETTHPAKDHLKEWQPAFEYFLKRLVVEGYSDLLIDHVKKTLK